MRIIGLCSLILLSAAANAQKATANELIEMARTQSPNLEPALRATFGEDALKKGTAFVIDHADFLAAISTNAKPLMQIDQLPRVVASKVGGLWIYTGPLRAGTAHRFNWSIDAQPYGGGNNIAAFAKDSYPQTGVPEGKLTGPIVMESKVYPGMSSNVWYYVPAQWDGTTPLAVQIWGDGQFYVTRPSNYRVLDALDNLTHQKKIPLMANIFIQPGTGGPRPQMRSIEYDTVDDTYARFLLEDILPQIGNSVKLRPDGYSRAIVGESSGGICAFTAAYFKPDQFTRVLSWIGSFAALQVSPAHPAGGAEYPIMVRREQKRNIRVWLQDGAEDQENARAGSWPLGNIHLANSLKLKSYDYHFSFGPGTHSQAQGSAELPESLVWLWREYDPTKTTQEFTPEPGEKDKPLWRVVTLNRD